MAQKQTQQPIRLPAGLNIESGWSDKERKEWLDKKARPDGFVFDEMKKEQAKDRRNG